MPHFRALLSYNLAANKLTELVTVRAAVVAHPPGSKQVRQAVDMTVTVCIHTCVCEHLVSTTLNTYACSVHTCVHARTHINLQAAPTCGSLQVVVVPNRGIWGTAGIDGSNIDEGISNDGEYLRVRLVWSRHAVA